MQSNSLTKRKGIPTNLGGILVAIGVVYGDIGTSPMYVMKSILAGNGPLRMVQDDLILGALSLIIWTITLLTTVKYVLIAMQADNNGEGGIFALFSLVRKYKKWLVYLAMIGGSALLADGILTPAVTVTTAVEGLRTIPFFYRILGDEQHKIVLITLVIIAVLFLLQRAGTSFIGKAFGPIMTIWFIFLALTGVLNMSGNWQVLRAFNPMRGVQILFSPYNKLGIMILGGVFLATTGAEALYSDVGHVGKGNIYCSWPFVKICLILNYLGQGAWLMKSKSGPNLWNINDMNPFFEMLPANVRPFAVAIGTASAVIASQALITGSFTLVSEAIRLDLMPHLCITYPSETKGQMYIPLINMIIWVACSSVVIYFKSSIRMEAAYGLAITLTMLMTTILLFFYLFHVKHLKILSGIFLIFFGGLEGIFFVSSLTKFTHGGYVAVLLATLIFIVMLAWKNGTEIERSQFVLLPIKKYLPMLKNLREDTSLPIIADNLVYITNDPSPTRIDRDILYSILDKRPKRANAYWFVSVYVTDEPHTREYSVKTFDTDYFYKVTLRLGFKEEQRINLYLRQIINDLIESGEFTPQNHNYSIYNDNKVGDFRFCVLRKLLIPESDIKLSSRIYISLKYAIRRIAGSPMRWFGLENSVALIEYVPLFIRTRQFKHLKRID